MLLTALTAALGPFIINGTVEFAKVLTGFSSTAGKRLLLAIAAILGAISFSALTGTPVNVESISSLVQIALEAFAAFLAAHGSYSLLTGKTVAAEVPNE
jgi:hypothetical protein